jgi:hypothetical protein
MGSALWSSVLDRALAAQSLITKTGTNWDQFGMQPRFGTRW